MADLRIGVGAPWHGQRAHPVTAEEKSVANDDSCRRVGNVSKLKTRGDVSGGKDPPIGRAHPVVDFDAVHFVVLDAGRFESEPGDVGRAARAHEYLVYHELGWRAAKIESQYFFAAAALDPRDCYPGQQSRPVAQDCLFHQPRGLFVFSRQDMGPAFK